MAVDPLEAAIHELARLTKADAKKVRSAAEHIASALRSLVTDGLLKVREANVAALHQGRDVQHAQEIEKPTVEPLSALGPAGEFAGGLDAAIQGGRASREATWASAEMLTSDEAAKRLHLSREALNKKRHGNRLLGLEATKRGVRYPKWQFEDDVLPHVPRLLGILSYLDPWGKYLFFTTQEPLLDGLSPLECLRRDRAAEVARVAILLAEDETSS